jgi:pimeloyl-ACP methyl ester carboxylesterase
MEKQKNGIRLATRERHRFAQATTFALVNRLPRTSSQGETMPFAVSGGLRLHYEVSDPLAPWHRDRATVLFHHGAGASDEFVADRFYLEAPSAELRSLLPDAELHAIDHAKHGLPFSHGRECAAALRRFLDRRFAGSNRRGQPAP